MLNKKFILGVLSITIVLILFILGSRGFSNVAGDPYSNKSSTSIGAWYDETWQASVFYRIERIETSNSFRYRYTTTPTTSSAPTFSDETATMPQDMVVTEWKVTGHLHFSSGI